MMHVVQRTDQDGGYLGADPGRTGQTWVRNIQDARMFQTIEQAREECCENERVVSLKSACVGWA